MWLLCTGFGSVNSSSCLHCMQCGAPKQALRVVLLAWNSTTGGSRFLEPAYFKRWIETKILLWSSERNHGANSWRFEGWLEKGTLCWGYFGAYFPSVAWWQKCKRLLGKHIFPIASLFLFAFYLIWFWLGCKIAKCWFCLFWFKASL